MLPARAARLGSWAIGRLGLLVLAGSGISFTASGQPIEFLGLRIATSGNHFISPVVGALALVGGVVLLVVRPRRA